MEVLRFLTLGLGALLSMACLAFAGGSLLEKEPRAARRACGVALAILAIYLLAGLGSYPGDTLVRLGLVGLPFLAGALLFLPGGQPSPLEGDTPRSRVDERDTLFARNRLQAGTPRFEEYYRAHPEKRPLDDAFRAKPGLLRPSAPLYNPLSFTAADASFGVVSQFHSLLDQPPAPERKPADAGEMTAFVKAWGKKLGAVSVGITELRPYHVYSHLGRNEPYGQAVELTHRYAIALSVEMDKDFLACGPHGPTVMESAQQYLAAGAIAVQLAGFIKGWGYPARAHIDGNYRVICPLVGRDAGLGELGRMGLLMTPELGPRVRLAVVTTDLPLLPDQCIPDPSLVDFCRRCRKCAEACPGHAIPLGEQALVDGVRRWQINSEACFTYWCSVGTDCGRCMSVCPYSHPDNWMHRPVRWGLRRSALFRALALALDDFFYGRKPNPRPVPSWLAGPKKPG